MKLELTDQQEQAVVRKANGPARRQYAGRTGPLSVAQS